MTPKSTSGPPVEPQAGRYRTYSAGELLREAAGTPVSEAEERALELAESRGWLEAQDSPDQLLWVSRWRRRCIDLGIPYIRVVPTGEAALLELDFNIGDPISPEKELALRLALMGQVWVPGPRVKRAGRMLSLLEARFMADQLVFVWNNMGGE